MLSNTKISKNSAEISIDPDMHSMEVIYSASYALLDKAYILLKGDQKKKIIAEIHAKDAKTDINSLAGEFNDQLISQSNYFSLSNRTKDIKQMIMHEIFTHYKEPEKTDGFEIDDPEGILIPWEEKYGKSAEKIGKNNEKS